jgi:hypothetical protein
MYWKEPNLMLILLEKLPSEPGCFYQIKTKAYLIYMPFLMRFAAGFRQQIKKSDTQTDLIS